jgi:Ca2+/H+ antiporter
MACLSCDIIIAWWRQLNYGSATMLGSVASMLLWAVAIIMGFGMLAGGRRRAGAIAAGAEADSKQLLASV